MEASTSVMSHVRGARSSAASTVRGRAQLSKRSAKTFTAGSRSSKRCTTAKRRLVEPSTPNDPDAPAPSAIEPSAVPPRSYEARTATYLVASGSSSASASAISGEGATALIASAPSMKTPNPNATSACPFRVTLAVDLPRATAPSAVALMSPSTIAPGGIGNVGFCSAFMRRGTSGDASSSDTSAWSARNFRFSANFDAIAGMATSLVRRLGADLLVNGFLRCGMSGR